MRLADRRKSNFTFYRTVALVLLLPLIAIPVAGCSASATGGLPHGIVTLSFDDGFASAYNNGLPVRKVFKLPATDSVITGTVDTGSKYITTAQCKSYQDYGDELASETVTHPFLTKLTPAQVDYELSASKNWIEQRFGPCPDFVIPYDDYNDSVIASVKKYYKAARSSDPGFNTVSSLYYYDILVQVVYNTTTPAQVQKWVQTAIDNHSWLVLEYHDVDNSGSQYSVTPADLTTECRFIHTSGIECKTMQKAIAEIAPYLK
jgi:peptidoglycan/xylan/chitin deacetylase (PgdA/CDA1 family)